MGKKNNKTVSKHNHKINKNKKDKISSRKVIKRKQGTKNISPKQNPKDKQNNNNTNCKKFELIKSSIDIQDLNPYCNTVIFNSISNVLFLVYASGDYSISFCDIVNKVKI